MSLGDLGNPQGVNCVKDFLSGKRELVGERPRQGVGAGMESLENKVGQYTVIALREAKRFCKPGSGANGRAFQKGRSNIKED